MIAARAALAIGALGLVAIAHAAGPDDNYSQGLDLFFPLLGAFIGFVWGEAKKLQAWFGITLGAIAGLIVMALVS